MTRFLKDGVERVVQFDTRPEDIDAITVAEWTAADDHSQKIVKPLDIDFVDSNRFKFATLDVEGDGDRAGKSKAAGTIRLAREYDESDMQPHATADAAFGAMGTKGTVLRLGVYRGPKKYSAGALVAGDEYDYFEFETDNPRTVKDEENYICVDVPLVFLGTSASKKALVAGA